eukprot:268558_1
MGCIGSSEEVLNPASVDLSHFVIGACIGKGGFGKVHAVLHKGTGVQMAMKRLAKNKIVGKDWQVNAVWVERNLLELLQNPYTNRLYFAFQSPWELFLVMPYYRGGDLNWYLNTKGKLKTNQIQYYAAELVLALSELRRLKVVYRDFKPENCLFNDGGHLCISDFGICGQLTENNEFKLSDRFGTTPYMSPNQYKGKPYDFCCDYFAFGLVLYEMATGKMLHENTPKRNIEQETNEWYETKLNMIQSPVLKSLIRQLLQVNREKRLGVNDIKEIFDHKFFNNINWKEFSEMKQTQKPPHIPDVKNLNCSLENLAMDAISDEDPTDLKPPCEQQQKSFDEFQFNTDIKKEWSDYWNDIKIRKDKEKYIQTLWDKAVDTNAFDKPKSELPIDFDTVHIEIKRSMSTQLKDKKYLIDPKETTALMQSVKEES